MEIITIVLIVVVVIALAVIFKDRLTTLLGNVFDKTDNAVDTLGQ